MKHYESSLANGFIHLQREHQGALSPYTININANTRYQSVIGFGGALLKQQRITFQSYRKNSNRRFYHFTLIQRLGCDIQSVELP